MREFRRYYINMFDSFVFPVNFNDLEQEQLGLNRRRIALPDLAIPERDILRRLKSLDALFNEDYSCIGIPEHFDFLYGLIKSFSENLESKSMRILQQLSSTIQYITQHILNKVLKINDDEEVLSLRLAFKMVIFLCLYFVSSTAVKRAKQSQTDLLAGKKKSRSEGIDLTRQVIDNQKACLQLLKESLKIDFVTLWERKEIDTQYFKKYADVCIKILESTLGRDEEATACLFKILETILSANYCDSLGSSFQTVLANLVYEGEVIDNLVNFFAKAEGAELQKLCVQSLTLVVVYLVNRQNLNAQSQSVKNTKDFLSKLSEKIPKVFYTNLSCFISLFKHESYILRNAIADIMMNILIGVLAEEQAEETYRQAREKFISTLLQRIYDKNSFCRSHVLGILAQLATDKVVPRKFLILFMKAGIDRVKDQSINTRRKALQLINATIDQLCTVAITPLPDIEREIEIAELELKTLAEEEQRLKGQIDQADDEERLEELVTDVKLIKKRMKATEEKQLGLFEEKEVSGLVGKVLENVRVLLGSKSDTDVLQTIKLFIKLHKLGFEAAKQALPDIRVLIFSRQKKIKDEVLTNFIYLHLSNKSEEVAKELINLFAQAAPQDLSALEEILETIIAEAIAKGITIIKPQAFAHMWNQFIAWERQQINYAEKRAILTILRIAFSKDPALLREQNLQSFLNILKAYAQSQEPDFHIVREVSRIICMEDPKIARTAKQFLIAQTYILVNTQGTSNNEWFAACQSILTCIFKICESPEKLSELLLKKLHERLDKDKSVKSLCHFIFALSHNCLKCLIYLDSIETKVKAMRQKQLADEAGQQEEELDKVMGGAEAQLERKIEEIQNLAERMLEDPFINRWVNIIQKIVVNFKQGSELQIICVLAYCKFMCLSSSFCQQKFSHVIRLLSNPQASSVVKNNIIIAMGDLLHRFPNVIQPYNRHLYQNLHEADPRVRKTTLTVITHLSLNDMIKVRSDMCDVALLFEDPDPEIQSLVKQFFHEMNKKDPKILFNLIPDALIRFSNVQKQGSASTFKVFLENILPLLEKDKYSESLVLKLCERLANSLNLLQIANTAHCLAEININEKGLRRIIQNFESFRRTLENPEVLTLFRNLIAKLRKSQKNDIKALIEELEEKVNHSGEEVFNAEQVKRRNQEKLNRKQPKRKPANSAPTANKRPRKRKDQMEEEEQEQYEEPVVASRARPQRQGRKMRVIQESQQPQQQRMEDEDYA